MAFWIILTGILVAANCGLLGNFLMLRKLSMLGDAISHAVLPGIVIAYFVGGYLGLLPSLIGAGLSGLFCTYLIEVLKQKAKLKGDAAIGITYTLLFSIGIILISAFAQDVHLDQDMVLFGEILFIPLNTTELFDLPIPTVIIWQFGLLVSLFIIIGIGFKGFVISAFNSEFAETKGIKVNFWHYLLMSLVSITTVLSFEAVGAILVVAFMVIPAAIAYLLSQSLLKMIPLTLLSGIVMSTSGYYVAWIFDASVSGAMALTGGIILALIILINQGLRKRKPPIALHN